MQVVIEFLGKGCACLRCPIFILCATGRIKLDGKSCCDSDQKRRTFLEGSRSITVTIAGAARSPERFDFFWGGTGSNFDFPTDYTWIGNQGRFMAWKARSEFGGVLRAF